MDAIFASAGFVPTPPAVPYDVLHFTHPLKLQGALVGEKRAGLARGVAAQAYVHAISAARTSSNFPK